MGKITAWIKSKLGIPQISRQEILSMKIGTLTEDIRLVKYSQRDIIKKIDDLSSQINKLKGG